jgi:N-acetyl sugar amidotransferase
MNLKSKNHPQYKQCINCVMDTTDPLISFDSRGVCNHCKYYEDYANNGMISGQAAEKMTREMVAEIKMSGVGKEYDCIMGLSGGVDSSYLAYYATQILKLRVLAVHVDTGWNSELAVNNIENIVKKLSLDLHTLVIDWNEMRDLQRAFFKSSVPNCDIPQDHAFIAALFSEAKKFNLRHILNGGNMSTESILPAAWGYDAADLIHVKDIHNRFGELKLKTYPTISFYEKKIKYPYFHKLKVHRPLEYIPYNKEKVKSFLMDELDWRDYGGKHYESKFTQFFQAYYLPEKYGFNKKLAHLSSLIVSRQLTKNEALEELREPLYDSIQFEEDRDFFIKKLGFSREEWDSIMVAEPMSENDYKNEKSLTELFNAGVRIFLFPSRLFWFLKRIVKKIIVP